MYGILFSNVEALERATCMHFDFQDIYYIGQQYPLVMLAC